MPKRASSPGEYPCVTCRKRFSRRADLQRHVQGTHERTRSYQCLFCPYMTSQEHNCVRHMRTVHDKPNEVPLLLLKFEMPASLTSSASTSRSTTPGSSFSARSLPEGFYSIPNLSLYPLLYPGGLSLPASGSSTPRHLPRSRSAPAQLSRCSSRLSPYPQARTGHLDSHHRHSMQEIASPAQAGSAPGLPRSLSVGAQPFAKHSTYIDPLLSYLGLPQTYAPTSQPTSHSTQQQSPRVMPSAPLSEQPEHFQPDSRAEAPISAVADNSHMSHSQNTLTDVSPEWATFQDLMQQGLPSLEELASAFNHSSFD